MDLKFVHADGSKIIEHDITLKTEVLLEFISGISADLGRYLDKNEIDIEKNESNPMVLIYWDLEMMRRSLYKMKKMEQVMEVQNKSTYIRDLVKKLT